VLFKESQTDWHIPKYNLHEEKIMRHFSIQSLVFIISTTIFSTAFAQENNGVVTLYNATNCHVTLDGKHYSGSAVDVATYDSSGAHYDTIGSRQQGKAPIFKDNDGQLYIVANSDQAADAWLVPYKPGDTAILSYDGNPPPPGLGCDPSKYQCLILSNFTCPDNPFKPLIDHK
jgi:hypothetical protein